MRDPEPPRTPVRHELRFDPDGPEARRLARAAAEFAEAPQAVGTASDADADPDAAAEPDAGAPTSAIPPERPSTPPV